MDLAPAVHYPWLMLAIRDDRLNKTWWIRGVMIAAALLTLATGFCLFDQDDDGSADHVMRPDLCLAMLAVSLAVMPLIRPLAVGWAVSPPVGTVHVVARHIPDPPPRLALFR
jgi:hypothetical protein